MRSGIAAFAGLVLFVTGCTSASTSTTAPSATKCAVSATTSSRSFPHTGGAGTIAVTSARECNWTISSDASWLVLERSSGQGEASLPFRVTANDTPKARRGTLALESTRLELAQDGAPCTFHLDHTRVDVGAGGAVARIGVTAMSDCAWSARALESWISVTSGASASGTGVVESLDRGKQRPRTSGVRHDCRPDDHRDAAGIRFSRSLAGPAAESGAATAAEPAPPTPAPPTPAPPTPAPPTRHRHPGTTNPGATDAATADPGTADSGTADPAPPTRHRHRARHPRTLLKWTAGFRRCADRART